MLRNHSESNSPCQQLLHPASLQRVQSVHNTLGRQPGVLQTLRSGQPLTRIYDQDALDEVLRLGRDVPQLRQAVKLVAARQDLGYRSKPVPAVEGALATRDQHVGDDPNAPTVGGRSSIAKIQEDKLCQQWPFLS